MDRDIAVRGVEGFTESIVLFATRDCVLLEILAELSTRDDMKACVKFLSTEERR